ncbi:cell wall hydrolase [Novosphingobium panipatense]|uniref:Cell wall hydrolase CwlJ, involved in spore germination n=1 Tax=Novosphingobium panipatense TaxID=428991 RepID=A0ABY1QRN3_9SPHN|nr:cell wall hydrolase [Novosphingobium panipatense]SMP78528.1 Cell wall hydrolase CwlJ, involved in spore germination [Novosphingobium panipatense]
MRSLPSAALQGETQREEGNCEDEVIATRFAIARFVWLFTAAFLSIVLTGSCLEHASSKLVTGGVPPFRHTALQKSALALSPPDPTALTSSDSPPPLNREKALALNAAVPFSPTGIDRPAPFRIQRQDAAYTRALDCLASAVLYEAGDDRTGQAAVAQVVLNRVRHPAFPHSVCGVVYQGAERSSGCQFTFTCDGALARIPSAGAWHRARETAASFLRGETYPPVGMATHYHTDWVHPYWSTKLDKIAQIGTHLFFRWQGRWGRQSAFRALYVGQESFEPKLQSLSPAHRRGISSAVSETKQMVGLSQPVGETLAPREGDHFILVDGGGDGGRLALAGLETCAGQIYCKIVGWDRRSGAFGSPEAPIIRTVAFLYVRDSRTGVEVVLWDCLRFNRPTNGECISDKNRRWITFQGDLSRAS